MSSGDIASLDGRATLDFEDPEGQRFRITADDGHESHPWSQSPVPAEHQIRGLGPITISVPDLEPTKVLLTRVLNMRELRDYPSPDGAGQVHIFGMGDGGAAAELLVAEQPDLPIARQGAGAVHADSAARRGRGASRGLPDPGCGGDPCGPGACNISACRPPVKSSATTSARSTSARSTSANPAVL